MYEGCLQILYETSKPQSTKERMLSNHNASFNLSNTAMSSLSAKIAKSNLLFKKFYTFPNDKFSKLVNKINGVCDTLMAYFVQPPNSEESFNKFLSPDPDHPKGGPSHGYNTSCVKKTKSIGAIVFELRVRTDKHTDRQIDPNASPSQSSPEARVIIMMQ